MELKLFDKQFESITKEMVEIAFEMADFNNKEVDVIFILGSIEDGIIHFKVFFSIKGVICRPQDAFKYSTAFNNLSSDKQVQIQRLGNESLQSLKDLFSSNNRDIPTLIKMKFRPKEGELTCKLSYELQYSNSETRGFVDVYNDWIKEEKNLL